MLFVVGPNNCITNPRWRTAAILEKLKTALSRKGLTDLLEIWHSYAYWLAEPYR